MRKLQVADHYICYLYHGNNKYCGYILFEYLRHVSRALERRCSFTPIIVKCNISISINVDEKHKGIHNHIVFVRSQHSTAKFTHIRFFMRLNQFKREMFNTICTVTSRECSERTIIVYCLVKDKLYMLEIEN